MVCFHPIPAFYPIYPNSDGKRHLLFGRKRHYQNITSGHYLWQLFEEYDRPNIFTVYTKAYDSPYDFPVYYNEFGPHGFNIKVPCGKCLGCRLDYSRMWATRSSNEAFMHNHYNNCSFLTLTFNSDMLNRRSNPHSLNKVAFRSWIKRLRKAVKSTYNVEFRYMCCGEYGSRHSRPHYHMLIYGFNFPDKYVYKYNNIRGKKILYYRSDFLEKIWSPPYSSDSYGFSVIGDVNFESSAYVARYVTKKLFGPLAEKVYKHIEPEFLLTSRMPGLGFSYLSKFRHDIFNHGYIVLPNGNKAPIPRYYVDKLLVLDSELSYKYSIAKWNKRLDNLFVENIDSTTERLIVREELKKNCLNMLHRQYEFNNDEINV